MTTLAEARFVAGRIIAVTGQTHDVVWELSLAERAWGDVLAELSDEVPPQGDEAQVLASNLMRDTEPKVVFDYWYDALAVRVRRRTTWVATASGTDAAVIAELVSIENYYAAALMQAQVVSFVEPVLRDELRRLLTVTRELGASDPATVKWIAGAVEVLDRTSPAA